jgi:acyl-CoA dehydrogenase
VFGFEPSEEQKTLVDSVRRFAARKLRAHARDADEGSELPPDLMAAGSELALLPASLPEAYGGFGERSALTGALFAEELAWGDLSAALALLAPGLVALPVLLAGTEAQKRDILPPFCAEGYVPGAAALLEKWMRDAKINDLFEGTGQINRLVIARRILGYTSRELK